MMKETHTQVFGKGGEVVPMLDYFSSIEDHTQAGQDLACFAAS